MDNKLSDLSKPVAILALLAELEASILQCRGIEQERELFRLERTAHQLHAQALEQRIAELESDLGLKHIRAVEEALIFATDRNSELEAKLATPVRLPEKFSMLHRTDFHEDYHSTMAFKSVEVFDAIRSAGFTFTVGDE